MATDALVYLKVPLSRAGGAAHARHYRLITRLRRLCPGVPVPEPLAFGETQGHRYGIEAALTGTPGARVRGNIDQLVARAASALAGLHRGTRSNRVGATGQMWQRRMRSVARQQTTRERKGIEGLCNSFVESLTRLPFTVTAHNDYHLGNVLFEECGSVSGILDWDSADLHGLPGVDIVHLVVSSYRRRTGAPLGQTISRWLSGHGKIEEEVFKGYCDAIELPVDLTWCVTLYVGVELWRLCLQQRYGLRCPGGLRRIDAVADELVALGSDLATRDRV
jgi:aminoglycoside phosphotransferase (APT) family kinase protein